MRPDESPRDRIKGLLLALVSSPTLVHIILGGWLGSIIAGNHVLEWTVGLLLSLLAYAVGDEIQRRIAEAKRDYLKPESDKGIE